MGFDIWETLKTGGKLLVLNFVLVLVWAMLLTLLLPATLAQGTMTTTAMMIFYALGLIVYSTLGGFLARKVWRWD